MKTASLLMTVAVVGTACLMGSGCQPTEEKKAEHPTAAQVELQATAGATATEKAGTEHPEAVKPKDHPAH